MGRYEMTKSESITKLAAALVALEAEIQNPKNTATNPFLKNKYAPLNDLLTEYRPLMAKHGLAIVQLPAGEDRVGVTTMLIHQSGEWVADTVEMTVHDEKGKSNAQVAGSIITYLRRYAVSAVLGIASEDDTDGNRPNGNGQKKVNLTPLKNGLDKTLQSAVDEGFIDEAKKEETLEHASKYDSPESLGAYIQKVRDKLEAKRNTAAAEKVFDGRQVEDKELF
jgi:hypothetical protein